MARYGVEYYGGLTTYGEPAYVEFNASPVRAISHAYGRVVIRWTHPEGTWSEVRLVRSRWGFPLSIYDGATVYEATRAAAGELVVDSDVDPGRFYYYQVFVFDSTNLQWRRAGGTQVLVLKDFLYLERLLDNIPAFYTEQSRGISADAEGVSHFEKFLMVFARGLAHVRGEYDSLGWIRDIDSVSGALVPLLAHDLGVQFEPELGIRQMRIWLRNAVYLYKIKGTRKGIEGISTAVTGWGATVPDDGSAITIQLHGARTNLIPNPSFEVDVSGWTATNATLTHQASEPADGLSSGLITVQAAGPASIEVI